MAASTNERFVSFTESAVEAAFTYRKPNEKEIRRLLREFTGVGRLSVSFAGDPDEFYLKTRRIGLPRKWEFRVDADENVPTTVGTMQVELQQNETAHDRLPGVVALRVARTEFDRTFSRKANGDIEVSRPGSIGHVISIDPLECLLDHELRLAQLDIHVAFGNTVQPPIHYELLLHGVLAVYIQENVAVCLLKPKIKWLDRRQIHCADGPAIIWASGEKEYYWRGLKVPPYFITRRHKLSLDNMMKIRNAEYRRVMMEIIGPERIVESDNVEKVQEDSFGELYSLFFHGTPSTDWRDTSARFVRVVNGTRNPDGSEKHYFLWVPDSMRSAHEAVAWTYGMTKEEYNPAIRT